VRYLIADSHCDSILDVASGKRILAEETNTGHLDFPRMMKGQIALQFMALFIEQHYRPHGVLMRTLELIDLIKNEINKVDYIDLVLNKNDLNEFVSNKPKILLAIEGGEAICGSLGVLRCFFNLGIRSMTLTWNYRNEIADGCGEEPFGQGLSKFGQEVVREMNRLGMLIDVSHLSEKSFWDVLKYTEQPVIASHSCCKALSDHKRNLSNEQMKALAEMGGVLAINFYPPFLNLTDEATIEDVVNHITYASEIMGVEHVGLGSDFDGIETVPTGLENIEYLPRLIDTLENKGFSSEEIAKIMGNNIIGLLKRVL
jgi:membrane dipeptidase